MPLYTEPAKKELSRKMQELEAAEDVVAEAFARQKEAATAHRLAFSRQLELLQHAATVGVPSLGHVTISADRTTLSPQLKGHMPTYSLGVCLTSNLTVDLVAIGSTTLVNVAFYVGLPRPGEASQERACSVPSATPPVASSSLACPICAAIYLRRKDLLYHLRTSTDEPHKTFRYDT